MNEKLLATRDGFGKGLVEAAQLNPAVVGLCGDLTESTRMEAFATQFPARFFQVGVAEQNMMGLAAGLALQGKVPFVASYAVFSPARTWDQLRVGVCYSNLNVKVVGSHTGLSVGPDGAVHQALEDLALTRVLPNMTVVIPADSEEARQATLALASHQGPAYLRLSRLATSPLPQNLTFQLGKGNVLKKGSDVCVIAIGTMVSRAWEAAQLLESQGITTGVVNLHTLKPLDTQLLEELSRSYRCFVTAEEHQSIGGLGSAVSEYLSEVHPVPIIKVAVKDTFGESGPSEAVMEKYGLTSEAIVTAAQQGLAITT